MVQLEIPKPTQRPGGDVIQPLSERGPGVGCPSLSQLRGGWDVAVGECSQCGAWSVSLRLDALGDAARPL